MLKSITERFGRISRADWTLVKTKYDGMFGTSIHIQDLKKLAKAVNNNKDEEEKEM